MSQTVVVDLVLGVLPFVVGFATYRLSARTQQAADAAAGKAVDAAAFDRARGIYLSAISQLEHEADAGRRERERLAGEVARLSAVNDRLEVEAGNLEGVRGEVKRLTEANRHLREQLAAALGG